MTNNNNNSNNMNSSSTFLCTSQSLQSTPASALIHMLTVKPVQRCKVEIIPFLLSTTFFTQQPQFKRNRNLHVYAEKLIAQLAFESFSCSDAIQDVTKSFFILSGSTQTCLREGEQRIGNALTHHAIFSPASIPAHSHMTYIVTSPFLHTLSIPTETLTSLVTNPISSRQQFITACLLKAMPALSKREIESDIEPHFIEHSYTLNQTIFAAGTPNDSICILRSGNCTLVQSPHENRKTLVSPNELFGHEDIALADRISTCTAITKDTIVYEIDKRVFMEHAKARNILLSCALGSLNKAKTSTNLNSNSYHIQANQINNHANHINNNNSSLANLIKNKSTNQLNFHRRTTATISTTTQSSSTTALTTPTVSTATNTYSTSIIPILQQQQQPRIVVPTPQSSAIQTDNMKFLSNISTPSAANKTLDESMNSTTLQIFKKHQQSIPLASILQHSPRKLKFISKLNTNPAINTSKATTNQVRIISTTLNSASQILSNTTLPSASSSINLSSVDSPTKINTNSDSKRLPYLSIHATPTQQGKISSNQMSQLTQQQPTTTSTSTASTTPATTPTTIDLQANVDFIRRLRLSTNADAQSQKQKIISVSKYFEEKQVSSLPELPEEPNEQNNDPVTTKDAAPNSERIFTSSNNNNNNNSNVSRRFQELSSNGFRDERSSMYKKKFHTYMYNQDDESIDQDNDSFTLHDNNLSMWEGNHYSSPSFAKSLKPTQSVQEPDSTHTRPNLNSKISSKPIVRVYKFTGNEKVGSIQSTKHQHKQQQQQQQPKKQVRFFGFEEISIQNFDQYEDLQQHSLQPATQTHTTINHESSVTAATTLPSGTQTPSNSVSSILIKPKQNGGVPDSIYQPMNTIYHTKKVNNLISSSNLKKNLLPISRINPARA